MIIDIESIKTYGPKAKAYYGKVEMYYKSLCFEKAVIEAASAYIPSNIASCSTNKTSFASHQRRVGKAKCKEGAMKLITHPFWSELEAAKSFEDIFRVTEKVKRSIYRLGDLWSYDTAQRIALHKGWYPEKVYLQTGAKKGAQILRDRGAVESKKIRGKRAVAKDVFPAYLSCFEPYLIENILCVSKNKGWIK